MALWTALTSFEEARYIYEAGLNTTHVNADLKHALENAQASSKSDSKIIKDFFEKGRCSIAYHKRGKSDLILMIFHWALK